MSEVVAGFDGSDEARMAVLWAAGEAASRGAALVLVDVVRWPMVGAGLTPGPPLPPVEPIGQEETLRASAQRRLAGVVEDVRRQRPDLEIRTRVELGRPAEVLADAADQAALLVIGSAGHTALPRMLLGSTAAELVRTCARPIVVVRHAKEPVSAEGGRVVVGVDGSSISARAIEFAYDFADRHGGAPVSVHAWSDLPMDALEPVRAWDEDWQEVRVQGERLLDES